MLKGLKAKLNKFGKSTADAAGRALDDVGAKIDAFEKNAEITIDKGIIQHRAHFFEKTDDYTKAASCYIDLAATYETTSDKVKCFSKAAELCMKDENFPMAQSYATAGLRFDADNGKLRGIFETAVEEQRKYQELFGPTF